MMISSYRILGVRVDDLASEDVLPLIDEFLREDRLHIVVTPNVDHVMIAQKDIEFRRVIEGASLAVADGKWLLRGARLAGIPLRGGISGRLLVRPICRLAEEHGLTVYILASRDRIATVAARNLMEENPGLQIVGARSPSIDFGSDQQETETIIREIEQLRPDIIFLGLGAPKSEKWLYANRSRISAKLGICVGYAFDVIAGSQPECSNWITRSGFEWAYRLFAEPGRLWRRYLVRDPQYFYLVLRHGRANAWTDGHNKLWPYKLKKTAGGS